MTEHRADIELGQTGVTLDFEYEKVRRTSLILTFGSAHAKDSQWPHRIPLQRQDRTMEFSAIRRGPIPPNPRHGARPQLRATSLRRDQSLPHPQRRNRHLPPLTKRFSNVPLRVLHLNTQCAQRALPPMRSFSRRPQRRIRPASRDGRRHVHSSTPVR